MSDTNETAPKRFHPILRLPFRAVSLAAAAVPIYPAMILGTNDIAHAGFYMGTAGFISGAVMFNGMEFARSVGNTFMDHVRDTFTRPKLLENFAFAAAIPIALTLVGYAQGYDKPIEKPPQEFTVRP